MGVKALAGMGLLGIGLLAGCSHRDNYAYAPPPPPPPVVYPGEVPPLVRVADQNGYRAGFDEGSRDVYNGAGYRPRKGRIYHDAPGYDYRLGPLPPYVDAFRNAYVRGYDQAYYQRR